MDLQTQFAAIKNSSSIRIGLNRYWSGNDKVNDLIYGTVLIYKKNDGYSTPHEPKYLKQSPTFLEVDDIAIVRLNKSANILSDEASSVGDILKIGNYYIVQTNPGWKAERSTDTIIPTQFGADAVKRGQLIEIKFGTSLLERKVDKLGEMVKIVAGASLTANYNSVNDDINRQRMAMIYLQVRGSYSIMVINMPLIKIPLGNITGRTLLENKINQMPDCEDTQILFLVGTGHSNFAAAQDPRNSDEVQNKKNIEEYADSIFGGKSYFTEDSRYLMVHDKTITSLTDAPDVGAPILITTSVGDFNLNIIPIYYGLKIEDKNVTDIYISASAMDTIKRGISETQL